jgi:hypothetical protein
MLDATFLYYRAHQSISSRPWRLGSPDAEPRASATRVKAPPIHLRYAATRRSPPGESSTGDVHQPAVQHLSPACCAHLTYLPRLAAGGRSLQCWSTIKSTPPAPSALSPTCLLPSSPNRRPARTPSHRDASRMLHPHGYACARRCRRIQLHHPTQLPVPRRHQCEPRARPDPGP